MQFYEHYTQESFARRSRQILNADPSTLLARSTAIEAILERQKKVHVLGEEDLLALLSPQADRYLEEIICQAQTLTRQRFGRVIQLFAPLYLSNYCHSTCSYCAFSRPNNIRRLTLSVTQALEEAELLYEKGIRHILLLTGEDYKNSPLSYMQEVIAQLALRFASVSIEVYPLEVEDYLRLQSVGLDGVAVYQETYDPQRYHQVHLGGMKKRMMYRLNCPDRVGRAKLRRLSIGALLGLSDPATEVFFLAMHARHLMRNYWQTELSISLPRLQTAIGLGKPPLIPDRDYIRYLCALRLFLPEVGLVLSTREKPHMREELAGSCITQMSAASKTEPGGYSGKASDEQFQISDHRSVAEVSQSLEQKGLEPVFIDWNSSLNAHPPKSFEKKRSS